MHKLAIDCCTRIMSRLALAVIHDVGLRPLEILTSYVVRSGLVAEGHNGCFVVVYVQRQVQPVCVVVFAVVV